MNSDKMQYLSYVMISYPFVNANTKGENGLQFINTDVGSNSTINGVTFARAIRDNQRALGANVWRTSNTSGSDSGYGYGPNFCESMVGAAETLRDPITKEYSQFLYEDLPHRGLLIAQGGKSAADRALSPEEKAEVKDLADLDILIKKAKKTLAEATDVGAKQTLQEQFNELVKSRKALKAKVDSHPKGEKLPPVKMRGLTQLSIGMSATPYPDDDLVFVQGTKETGDLCPFTYMRHFSRYTHCQTMDVKTLMVLPSCIKSWLQSLRGMQLGGGHTSNLSEFVPEVIVWRFHKAAGQGHMFLTPEDTKDWTPDAKIDLAPLFRKLANDGITDVNVGGLDVLRDGKPIGTMSISDSLDQMYDEIVKMWG